MGLLNLASGTFLWRGYGESRHISEVKGRITAGNAHNVYVFEKLREYTTCPVFLAHYGIWEYTEEGYVDFCAIRIRNAI